MYRRREESDRLYDLVDHGLIDWYDVAEMCLKYMREDDIAKMIDEAELSERFFEDEDEGEIDWGEEYRRAREIVDQDPILKSRFEQLKKEAGIDDGWAERVLLAERKEAEK